MAKKQDKKGRPYRKTITRHFGPDGKRCEASAPGAVAENVESQTWYCWRGGKDVPLRSQDGEPIIDEGLAWEALRRLQREAKDEAAGISTPRQKHAGRDILDHVADYVTALRATENTTRHNEQVESRLRKLIAAAGWKRLPDVTADSAQVALAGLGVSQRTRNHYLTRLKAFLAWAEDDDRIAKSPVRKLKPVKVTRLIHPRRLPTRDEVAALFRYLASPGCKTRRRMSPARRALLYRTSMTTGYRAFECTSLSWDSFDLTAGTVQGPTAYQKNRRPKVLPLPPWLVEELRVWKADGGELWGGLTRKCPGAVLRADLKAAGVAYTLPGPDGPAFFDYHALRKFYVTSLAGQPGMSPKTLLDLSRLSTAELALKTYAASDDGRQREAVDALPEPGCGDGCGEGDVSGRFKALPGTSGQSGKPAKRSKNRGEGR